MEMQQSTQEQAIRLTRVLGLIERNKRLIDVYKQQSPEDALSTKQYMSLQNTYVAELAELMKPYGVIVNYSAMA